MEMSLSALTSNLLAPTILFFVLGLVAALTRSDLSIPDGAASRPRMSAHQGPTP